MSHKIEELPRNATYRYKAYVKAYAYSAKNTALYFVSTMMQFTTANPEIIIHSIYPEVGTAGMTVTISTTDVGEEFEPLTVKFDDIEAKVLYRIKHENAIRVVVPEGLTKRLVGVSVTVGSITVVKADFFTQISGSWGQLGDGPSVDRALFTFTVYDRVYVGFEKDRAFYMYNAAADTWTPKADYPEGTICAFAPENSPIVLTSDNEIFFYDYSANYWELQADMTFPGVKRKSAVAFVVDSRPYVGLGRNDTTVFTDLWQYAPAHQDKWIRMEDFPGVPVRSYGNTLAFGAEGYAYIYNHPELWIYTPSTNSWTQKADFPLDKTFGPRGFLLNDELYLGSTDGYVWFYIFDHIENKWARIKDIPVPKIFPFAFSIGGKGYVGAGSLNINYQVTDKSVWMFTP